ncbi:MAG: molybdopterin molybdotransferase MoeA [Pseudomonadota bacterium]
MISVAEAYTHLFELVKPIGTEILPLTECTDRILRLPISSERDQPPFPASAMDGYAIKRDDAKPGATLNVIGEAAAGSRFDGVLKNGDAVRIFTGGVVPVGADKILIQEDCTRKGDTITLGKDIEASDFIRPAGADFKAGFTLPSLLRLSPQHIALAASMNHAQLTVARKPVVALIATGDELVPPGETPGADQIISSNNYGLKAMIEQNGALARILPIAGDTTASLKANFELAEDADLIVTLGGASVGDYDLVQNAAKELGLQTSFYKLAMRPGKPLMAGLLKDTLMIGLPGNPVSAMVCGRVFLVPVIEAMLGLPKQAPIPKMAPLANDLPENGPRAHYMRAILENGEIYTAPRQDSSLLSILASSNILAIRPPNTGPAHKGDLISYLDI